MQGCRDSCLSYPCWVDAVYVFFTDHPVTDYASAKNAIQRGMQNSFMVCSKEGFIFAPSQLRQFLYLRVHGEKEIDSTIEAFKEVIKVYDEAKNSPRIFNIMDSINDGGLAHKTGIDEAF